MKNFLLFCGLIFFSVVITGCALNDKHVPAKAVSVKNPKAITGKKYYFFLRGERRYDLYVAQGHLFIAVIHLPQQHYTGGVRVEGITRSLQKYLRKDAAGNLCARNVDKCMNDLFEGGAIRVDYSKLPVSPQERPGRLIRNELANINVSMSKIDEELYLFNYVNNSQFIPLWKEEYNVAVAANNLDALESYVTKYPESHLVDTAHKKIFDFTVRANSQQSLESFMHKYPKSQYISEIKEKLFDMLFDIALIQTIDGSNKPVTEASLVASLAGSCRDMNRVIKITPKTSINKPYNLNVAFTLNRTYEPYKLKDEGDPLVITREYTLNPQNNFTVTDNVNYDCVLTSGRFHSAAHSLIGRLLNLSAEQTSAKTTLKSTKFKFDVVDIY